MKTVFLKSVNIDRPNRSVWVAQDDFFDVFRLPDDMKHPIKRQISWTFQSKESFDSYYFIYKTADWVTNYSNDASDIGYVDSDDEVFLDYVTAGYDVVVEVVSEKEPDETFHTPQNIKISSD